MTTGFDFANLDERAAEAREAHQDYLTAALENYQKRCELRQRSGIIPVAVCGPGTSGKDVLAEYACKQFGLIYPKSASWMAMPFIAHMRGVSVEQAWSERHVDRRWMIAACNAVRGHDHTLLARMCLGHGDIVVGIRANAEFRLAVDNRIVHTTLWVERPHIGYDPTVEYVAADCDFIVNNCGSLEEFYSRIDKLRSLFRRE